MGGKARRLGDRFTAIGAIKDSKYFNPGSVALTFTNMPATRRVSVRTIFCRTMEPGTSGAAHQGPYNDFVRAPAYGVCLDAEKPKAYRFRDSTICR
jgi:hypothetical protein